MAHRTATAIIPSRLARLRDALTEHGLYAWLVPSSDPHSSEYLPERWKAREWLSGFTGSVASLVVSRDGAALFADSRYWLQAETELAGTGIALVKVTRAPATQPGEWLAAHVPAGQTVGVDGNVLGLAAAERLRAGLTAAGVALRTELDVLDDAWPERPALPADPIFEHVAPYAPLPRARKLEQLREAMRAHGATRHLISTTDDIAWLFNLRGADVSFNPVFLAHALVDLQRATLFVAEGKISAELTATLAEDGVHVASYDRAKTALHALGADDALLIDPRRVTLGVRESVSSAVAIIEAINPTTLLKSRKTAEEASHVRRAMEQDGAALCEFYAWFEAALGHERITELTVAERLQDARAKRPGFMGLSFNTIAGFNANGAQPHYRATAAAHAAIEGDGLLLIDSGGQYLGGTTDITRVWPIGSVSDAQRRDYTLVLKGTIALSRARFPRGTLSPMLDALARAPLWEQSLDYGHGTGHGVGYFLNVHEGPQSISTTVPEPHMAMEPGMITSIEPGLYRVGQWGIRIENLVLNSVVPAPEPAFGAYGEFLEFETLTLCPIDTRCIDPALLRPDEAAWLNAYHATVLTRLAPLVSGAASRWLEERTRSI